MEIRITIEWKTIKKYKFKFYSNDKNTLTYYLDHPYTFLCPLYQCFVYRFPNSLALMLPGTDKIWYKYLIASFVDEQLIFASIILHWMNTSSNVDTLTMYLHTWLPIHLFINVFIYRIPTSLTLTILIDKKNACLDSPKCLPKCFVRLSLDLFIRLTKLHNWRKIILMFW